MSQIMIRGYYRDHLRDADGRSVFDSGWQANLIVMRCRVLLAGFMKNDSVQGIQSLKLGQGNPAWDTTPPPVVDPNTISHLIDPSPFDIPNTDLTLQYLDEIGAIVPGPTNRIEIVANLGPGQPPPTRDSIYPLREFGLFGSLNGSSYMIDYIRHSLIEKEDSVTLERRVRLIF